MVVKTLVKLKPIFHCAFFLVTLGQITAIDFALGTSKSFISIMKIFNF